MLGSGTISRTKQGPQGMCGMRTGIGEERERGLSGELVAVWQRSVEVVESG